MICALQKLFLEDEFPVQSWRIDKDSPSCTTPSKWNLVARSNYNYAAYFTTSSRIHLFSLISIKLQMIRARLSIISVIDPRLYPDNPGTLHLSDEKHDSERQNTVYPPVANSPNAWNVAIIIGKFS